MVVVVLDMTSGCSRKLLVSNYSWTSTNSQLPTMATSLQWPLYLSCCFLFKPLNNGHLLTTVTATKACPHLPVFSVSDENVKNDHDLFHVYCCSKHKLSTILLRTLQTLLILSCSYFDPEHYQSLFVYFSSLCLLCMIGLPLWDTVNTK